MPVKFLMAIALFLVHALSAGQELTEKEKGRLSKLNFDHVPILERNPDYGATFRDILENDRKYKTNKTAGFVLGGLGLASTIGGILIMDNGNGNGLSRTIVGGGTTVLGLTGMGISIPLFTTSNKRRKERDKMISVINGKRK